MTARISPRRQRAALRKMRQRMIHELECFLATAGDRGESPVFRIPRRAISSVRGSEARPRYDGVGVFGREERPC